MDGNVQLSLPQHLHHLCERCHICDLIQTHDQLAIVFVYSFVVVLLSPPNKQFAIPSRIDETWQYRIPAEVSFSFNLLSLSIFFHEL